MLKVMAPYSGGVESDGVGKGMRVDTVTERGWRFMAKWGNEEQDAGTPPQEKEEATRLGKLLPSRKTVARVPVLVDSRQLLLLLIFRVVLVPTRKNYCTFHGAANPVCGLLNREKKKKNLTTHSLPPHPQAADTEEKPNNFMSR